MVCKPEKLFGHEQVLEKLLADADRDKLAGAMLFVGPSKIGKFTAARILARRLQCEGENCTVCPQIWNNAHPDTIVLDRIYVKGKREDLDKIARRTSVDQQYRVKKGVRTDTIGVDDVRQVIAQMSQKKMAKYKIALVRKVERLTVQGTNALLKFIEELPPQSIVIMTATDEERLLPTLVSRLQIVRFHNIQPAEQEKHLQELFPKKSAEQIRQAIWLGQGHIGRAVDFLRSPRLMEKYVENYREIEQLFEQPSLLQKFDFAQKVAADKNEITRFLRIFTYFGRQLLTAKMKGESNSAAQNMSLERIENVLRATEEARQNIKRNANPRLQIENLLLQV